MSLEGRIRDLGLHEVCQLLALSRKSGALRLYAPLHGVAAEIRFVQGAVVDAASWPADGAAGSRPDSPGATPGDAHALAETVLALLAWTDGEFRFVSADPASVTGTGMRLPVEPILVEAAQRAETWARVGDRVPHAGVVPAFVDVDPAQLPLLRLVPPEWELLTQVDGQRSIGELAQALGRDLLEVACTVHGLIGAGLLALRSAHPPAPQRHETPPSARAIGEPVSTSHHQDLWIPDDAPDIVFDPVEVHGLLPDRRPEGVDACLATAVASPSREPSLQREAEQQTRDAADAIERCRQGDDAARRGDLETALTHWRAALASEQLADGVPWASADRVREAITLATRLHALLHPVDS